VRQRQRRLTLDAVVARAGGRVVDVLCRE
jgi:hypothetical protein